ncbi:MAG TPA: type II secretion system protein GspL [Steroidobacteraceae bacterium]|nr:type II secretion system protein GspL [Steroidobacteraceae bacterium]
MPHTLLLRLPPSGEEDTEWLSIEESGAPSAARQRGPLSLAAAVARSARVVVLAPSAQILLAEPELPPGSGVKLARVVPFALEEQLTEDVDQLCFALGKRQANGCTPVAVVSRAVLQGWISQLAAAGIDPLAIHADISLIPENPGQTVLWLERSRLAVRRPGKLPFAVELTPVADALVVAGVIPDPLADPGADAGAEPAPLESAVLYTSREEWALVQDEFQALAHKFASLKVQLLADGPLPWLARDLKSTEAVNLLQGEFARSTDYNARWLQWRTAAMLAGGLLVAHIAAAAIRIHQANHETKTLDTEISQLFKEVMPAEKMVDPRRQMQSRLDQIHHAGASPEYFLHTLEVLSGAISSLPNTRIDALSYREQSLDLRVTAPNLAALSQLSQSVAKQGLTADIQSSQPAQGGVEAQMQVRSASGAKARP